MTPTAAARDPIHLLATDTFWELVRDELAVRAPQVEPILLVRGEQLAPELLARAEIACLSGDSYPERVREVIGAVQRATDLRWLHTFSAGVDSPVFGALMARGIRLTNSSGSSAPSIARTVVAYVLALSRDLPAWFDAQRRAVWAPHRFDEVIGQRMLVVGWGPIGQEVARLATALGLDVAIARRAADGTEPHPVVPLSDLATGAASADWLVLALPLTPETRGVVDADVLRAVPAGARFINVGRGEVVDEDALIDALASGHLGGAALDVTVTEPLPADHRLWTLPNVIVTPHASGVTDHTDALGRALFVENVVRYVGGQPMRNEITPPD